MLKHVIVINSSEVAEAVAASRGRSYLQQPRLLLLGWEGRAALEESDAEAEEWLVLTP